MATLATPIEWADRTWNPVRGCKIVSAGCSNCYAMRVAGRFSGPGQPFEGLARPTVFGGGGFVWTGKAFLVEAALKQPLSWKTPARIFVNSMSDLFYEEFEDEEILRVFHAMKVARVERGHTFIVLTKRDRRMACFFRDHQVDLDGIWLGVSVEDQETYRRRVNALWELRDRKDLAVRFISYEPALEAVDFASTPWDCYIPNREIINWIIVGGESGPRAIVRPFDLGWAARAIDFCRDEGIPLFVKQMGSKPFYYSSAREEVELHYKDRAGGNMGEWFPEYRVRQFPEVR
jgi:protein gp37